MRVQQRLHGLSQYIFMSYKIMNKRCHILMRLYIMQRKSIINHWSLNLYIA